MSTELSRKLRRNASPPERAMWAVLHHFRQQGFRFGRQMQIGSYYADFACLTPAVVIEVDGGTHTTDLAQSTTRCVMTIFVAGVSACFGSGTTT